MRRRDRDRVVARTCAAAASPRSTSKMANVAEPIVFTFPYRATPTTRERARRAADRDADAVADREVVLRRGAGVEDDLARAAGPAAARQTQRVEARLRRIDAETERRAAVAGDHLAVLVDQLRDVGVRVEVEDLAGGRLDARRVADAREQLRRDGRATRVRVVGERPAADDGVGLRVRAREDRVERLRDRVGEQEAAADHRDAEHDRERRERGAELPPEEASERDGRHDGVTSSRTISPSARCSTRSANAPRAGRA